MTLDQVEYPKHRDEDRDRLLKESLITFLHYMKDLQRLQLSRAISRYWSPACFKIIANRQAMRSLQLPYILDIDVAELPHFEPGTLLSNLKSLTTCISESALDLLVPHLRHVSDLILTISTISFRVLDIVACIPALEFLDLHIPYGSGNIHGRDLIRLAKNCPRMHYLGLGSTFSDSGLPRPEFVDVTDTTIEVLADRLRGLSCLHLDLPGATITELSFISLAKYCEESKLAQVQSKLQEEQ